jgi:hypothetical protein
MQLLFGEALVKPSEAAVPTGAKLQIKPDSFRLSGFVKNVLTWPIKPTDAQCADQSTCIAPIGAGLRKCF